MVVRRLCGSLIDGRVMAHGGMVMAAPGKRRRRFVVVAMELGRSGSAYGAVRWAARRHRVHRVALQWQCHGEKPSQNDAK